MLFTFILKLGGQKNKGFSSEFDPKTNWLLFSLQQK